METLPIGEAPAQWYAKRDALILELKQDGWPVAKLAKRFGITRARIYQILEAKGAPARARRG